jgi:hypothetical protein
VTKLFQNTSSVALIVGLTLPLVAKTKVAPAPEHALNINVRIYNYADVTSGILAKAQSESERIFRRAGIQTNWLACAVPGREVETNPSCKAKPGATDIQVRILPKKMAQGLMKHHSEFGLAFTTSGDGFGSNASIFYHRVEELSERRHTSKSLLLGHLIAHEIGHLLLGSNSHSRSGIMHVPWNRAQVERASLGTLLFAEQEPDKMRNQVSRRIAAAQNLTILYAIKR